MGTFTPARVRSSAPSTRQEPESWRESALCAEVDSDLFFPDRGGSVATPRELCGRCPVKDACLAAAMRVEGLSGDHHRHGIWGGLTPVERAALSKTWRFTK